MTRVNSLNASLNNNPLEITSISLKNKVFGYLGHYLLPEIAVIISFLFFSFHPGTLGDLMRVCGGIVLANLLVRNYRLNFPSVLPIYLILGFLVILALNFLAPSDKIHPRSFRYFLAFPGMTLATYYLILKKEEYGSHFSLQLYTGLLSGAIVIQLLVVSFGDNRETLGIYGNLHRLGLFSCIILPAIAYLMIFLTTIWWRILLVIAGILDLYLLFSSNSRVSWVAFLAGSLLTILIFFKGRQKIIATLGLFLVSLLAGMVFGLSRIVDSARSFIAHAMEESRWTIWSDTINLLKDNSLLDWFIGHGIGSFRYYFQDYSTYLVYNEKFETSFPHNGFLQVVFENGIIGFSLIFGALGLLMMAFIKATATFSDKRTKFFSVTIFAVFWIDFSCFIVNESIYSKYILYSFSIIIGIMMALVSKSKQCDVKNIPGQSNTRMYI